MKQTYLLWLLPALPFLYLATGIAPTEEEQAEPIAEQHSRAVATFLSPEDQITNEAGGSTTVRYSLVEGGLSAGVVDGGSNVDGDPAFTDHDGEDFIAGTIDDRVDVTSGSPAVDAGDNSALPADRFDLDGDGDTSEPVPVDISGMDRQYSGAGAAVVDMGASESDAMDTASESPDVPGSVGPTLTVPFPNPIRSAGTLEFSVPRSEHAQVTVFDLLGRRRAMLFDGRADADRTLRLAIDADDLPSGAYFVLLNSPSFTKTTHFVVVK